ncbi:P-loop nucleoside triphosphate hydrolases superfamily protein with CH (Calponin Homology) domain-containing protein [Tasmannia lanceolata]|uniref:P-loop nucleoside triphosphate hydrolases superfamily protein with CH (Calponin Homology) domain-containing protein n=1 Tax=Tasmannia lanceolata TaxID=3420 RepID=UPI004064A236
MNSHLVNHVKEDGEFNRPNGDVVELAGNADLEADATRKRACVVEWLNSMFPHLKMPSQATEEELKVCLIDGTVLCSILNRLCPGSGAENQGGSDLSSEQRLDNAKKFLSAMDEMGIPRFEAADLEQGPMTAVVECLLRLKDHFNSDLGGYNIHGTNSFSKCGSLPRKRWKFPELETLEGTDSVRGDQSAQEQNSPVLGEERKKSYPESMFQRVLRSPVMSEPSTALIHHAGHKFHEVFQLKQGRYSDLPAAKISEMMKSNSIDNAPTQSLLSVVNGILDESIERKNGEIPHRVACLLRKVVQEIERRISTQAEHIRTQNILIKAREEKYQSINRVLEEKYQSRITVFETLVNGTSDETQNLMNQLQQIKAEMIKMEEMKKLVEQDVVRLMKEKETSDLASSKLKNELEITKRTNEEHCMLLGTESIEAKLKLEERLKEVEYLLAGSLKKNKQLEAFSESKVESWNNKEKRYQNFISFQFQALRELRVASASIKKEILNAERSWPEEFNRLGQQLKGLADAAENYHAVLAENRKLYNEVQDLKGNIRVYCRIRPFLPGQTGKPTTIEYIGENGELLVVNPFKQGKDGHRMFKFNKVFGPTASQEEVFLDTQPLIRSVLDGYNVCIFAYGQTGSGKTYTMSGPNESSKEDWGVNYRALNDLFHISQSRRSTFFYEVGVQMVEIYNEQVRDLLTTDGQQKRLGIWSTSQPNGLAVPDASMYPVKSTSDVLELMQIGLMNRAVGATALNERSSRSHSVLTVHVRGSDLENGASLRGSLHLVDLAGSERVDRSEATGDRLREAQHINKSLSALGDVIFALAQKSPHVPYRNSKLTQVLQSSIGGQAKTLMLVQLNPDVESYSETISTLKFAERTSGVELGAARSNKDGRDVRELMEQVASLKDIIVRKDEEIERLHLLKDLKPSSPSVNCEKRGVNSLRHSSSSPGKLSHGGPSIRSRRLSNGRAMGPTDKAASDLENCSELSDKHSEGSSQQSTDDGRQSKLDGRDTGQNFPADVELLGFGDADSEERLSDISDGGLSMGAETEGSICSVVEFTLFPEGVKPAESPEKAKVPARIPRPPQKPGPTASTRPALKDSSKMSASLWKTTTTQGMTSSSPRPAKRWQ